MSYITFFWASTLLLIALTPVMMMIGYWFNCMGKWVKRLIISLGSILWLIFLIGILFLAPENDASYFSVASEQVYTENNPRPKHPLVLEAERIISKSENL